MGAESEWQATLDLEVGSRVGGCLNGLDFGLRFRSGTELGFQGVSLVVRFEHDFPGAHFWLGACAPARPQTAIAVTRPPPRQLPPPPLPPSLVKVTVEPLIIDVKLGVSLAGGLVRVAIDPRLLPLAKLRGAGHVRVEIIGPRRVLRMYRARLAATLNARGTTVDSWIETVANTRVVRARFTVWPPGSRPRP